MRATVLQILIYLFVTACLSGSTALAEEVSLKLVSMFQSGGGVTGTPLKPLLLLPSKGVTALDDSSLADVFLVVKNDSSKVTKVLSGISATFSVTLYSYSPTIDEVKDMPKELVYQFAQKFPHQPTDYTLLPGQCRIYEINFFKNQNMLTNPMNWLWVTGISKIKVEGLLHSEVGDLTLDTDWIPVEVQVPQFNTNNAGNH